jgi:CRISPR-associated protein Cpf1
MEIFKDFTNLFSLSKTLRFELIPIGDTLKHIEEKGIIKKDEDLYVSYQNMKNIIDNFHKDFIELSLKDARLSGLETFKNLYWSKNDFKNEENFQDEFQKIKAELRKSVISNFVKNSEIKGVFEKLFKKELITSILKDYLKEERDLTEVEKFQKFTTYFTGFNENRKNIYSDKEQSTSIAYRIIHENLPKFLDNLEVYEKIKTDQNLFDLISKAANKIISSKNLKIELDTIFSLNGFNSVLTQNGIQNYNFLIGGYSLADGNKKIQGINEIINLYNQKKEKNQKFPKFKFLYKQILSDRNSISFLPEKFENSLDVINAINEYYLENLLNFKMTEKGLSIDIFDETINLLTNLNDFHLSKIYIRNGKSITNISNKVFGNWSLISDSLEKFFLSTYRVKSQKQLENDQRKFLKKTYYSIYEIDEALKFCIDEFDELKNKIDENFSISSFYKKFFFSTNNIDFGSNISSKYSCIKGLLNIDFSHDKFLFQDKKAINDIKLFLDSILEVFHFIKPLMLDSDSTLDKDNNFYGSYNLLYDEFAKIIPLYNKVRNYSTQKPFSTEKFKLNFDNSTLLDGWDVSKEVDNSGVLLMKDGEYFLAIMDKSKNKLFKSIPKAKSDNRYNKINYKLLPGPNKMLPKVFFSEKNIKYFNPSKEIINIRNNSSFTKNGKPQTGYEKEDFNLEACWSMIDFYKDSIAKHEDWNKFGFSFSPTKTYKSIDEFYKEVEHQGYKISFTDVDVDFIEKNVQNGFLYLFKIFNKDFSPKSKGLPNLHTLYWKALFDEHNLGNVVYKLNGQAEIFYRKKSISQENTTIHRLNEKIKNKNPLSTNEYGIFNYEIIKDRRYTLDKFLFHVPININFKSRNNSNLNEKVLELLRSNENVNIIGIDRGERHLLYLSIINQKGQLLHQESLNSIFNKGTNSITNYQNLLNLREDERAESRLTWKNIESIKELKEGYLSQAVYKIARLMLEFNAIVVLEDLNMGFKRGRFKVEKQVYQKFEKMLIEKLNYLVLKEILPEKFGGVFNALQLTNEFKTFRDLGKQSGFLFYVPAWNTSKIDPTTGFVNFLNPKYETIQKSKEFFLAFRAIKFNLKEKYFEFDIDFNDFNSRADGTKSKWTICTYGQRIKTFRNPNANNQWDNTNVELSLELEDLFGKYNIDYGSGNCIKKQIASVGDKDFYLKLFDLFKLTLQIRNSITDSEEDYLISPVKNQDGYFFDSRNNELKSLPENADANGAFHIAKKGLMWIKQIQDFSENDWKKLKLDKTNKGWLNFVQA